MPSRAVYTALAVARSDTGCSTILIPWVEEPVMVTPEVVGHIDPVCTVVLRRTTRREIDSWRHKSALHGVCSWRLQGDVHGDHARAARGATLLDSCSVWPSVATPE